MTITRRHLAVGAASALAITPTFMSRQSRAEDENEDRSAEMPRDVVYVLSNNPTVGQNAILGYRRAADGTLTPLPGSPFLTGGRGFTVPNFPPPGPFDSDQEMVLDRRRGIIYAVNSGSSSVAAMRVKRDGSLSPVPYSSFAIPGVNPISVAVHRNKLIVLNADADPAQQAPGLHPTAVVADIFPSTGGVAAQPNTSFTFPDGSQPTQVTTSPIAPFVFTCEFLGAAISSFAVEPYGPLRLIDKQTPPQQAGATSAPVPLGIWTHDTKPILYVGFVNTSQLGVYSWDETGRLKFLRTATNSGAAICWLRTAFRGARLYSVNTADLSMSVYDTTKPEHPKEVQKLAIGGLGGLLQFDITSDERFLYVIEQANNAAAEARGNLLHVVAIDHANGSISTVPAATLLIPVPKGTKPTGVIAL